MARLLRLKLQDGSAVDLHRDGEGVRMCRQDVCVSIPNGTGKQALDLLALLEPLCETIEEPGEEPNEPVKEEPYEPSI